MLSDKLYSIGKKHNLGVKYNIEYNKEQMLDYTCGVYIYGLLGNSYTLNIEQRSKLTSLLNTLIVL